METSLAGLYSPEMLPMRRKTQKEIEDELQSLLDAQGEGLVAGLGNDVSESDDKSSGYDGGRPGSASRWNRDRTKSPPSRSRPRQKPSLTGARWGILDALRELATIKDAEVSGSQARKEESESTLRQLEGWIEKRDGLEKAVERIAVSDDATLLQRLEAEERSVKDEVYEVDTRLYQLKAKQRHLTSEISRVSNVVDARMSSYKASLSLLNKHVEQFLGSPPLTRRRRHGSNEPSSFLSLPPGRRTLAMAQQHWKDEAALSSRKLQDAEFERDALEGGAQAWEHVVSEVSKFETGLRRELRRLNGPARDLTTSKPALSRRSTTGPSGDDDDDKDDDDDDDTAQPPIAMGRVTSEMDRTMTLLERQLGLAEARGWRLLVCCIGAELEALREGMEVIQPPPPPQSRKMFPMPLSNPLDKGGTREEHDDATTLSGGAKARSRDDVHTNSRLSLGVGPLPEQIADHGAESQAQELSFRARPSKTKEDDNDDDEDEDPDPTLLVSHER